jgi:hypothetical protein
MKSLYQKWTKSRSKGDRKAGKGSGSTSGSELGDSHGASSPVSSSRNVSGDVGRTEPGTQVRSNSNRSSIDGTSKKAFSKVFCNAN